MNLSVTHLNAIAQRCHATAKEHGFWDDRDVVSPTTDELAHEALAVSDFGARVEFLRKGNIERRMNRTFHVGDIDACLPHQLAILSKLVLIVSEVAEAIDAILDGTGNLDEELADILIRTLDTAEGCGFDIGQTMVEKMAVNDARPRMHGKKA